MKITGAQGAAYGKWKATLACGHVVMLDSGLDPPTIKTVTCPVCEGNPHEEQPCQDQ